MRGLVTIGLAFAMTTQGLAMQDNGYNTDFVDLVEIVYGKGYLSQGGFEIVERMFEGVELTGKTILDLGCGIGGPTLHLAKNHDVHVVGIDPEAFMIQRSQEALEELRCDPNTPLKGSAHFAVMEDPFSLQQFPDNSFDIVTTREVIVHVPHEHKPSYFREILRVLKKGGQLVTLDWQHASPHYSDAVKEMMEADGVPFHLNTPKEYQQIVMQAGFSDVTIEDLTKFLAQQTRQDLATIDSQRLQIIEKFDQETYDYARNSWSIQGQAFADGELLVGLIKARYV